MSGYTKLFSELLGSSVWGESKDVKILWITMLAMRDKNHNVMAAVPGLGRLAGLSIEEVEAALEVLSSPDPHSRTEDHQGRRILKVDGGWFIVNGEKFRRKMSEDERREYERVKKQEQRERDKMRDNVPDSPGHVPDSPSMSTQTEAEKETKPKKKQKAAALTDDQWLESLKSNPAYSSLNLAVEVGKCKAWCDLKGIKTISRQRLLNWFNNAIRFSRGVELSSSPSSEPAPEKAATQEEILAFVRAKAAMGWVRNSVESEVFRFVDWCEGKGIIPTIDYIEKKCDKSRWNIYTGYKMGPNGIPELKPDSNPDAQPYAEAS